MEHSRKKDYLESFERRLKLDGREFVTTLFNPSDENSMILILGHNLDGCKEGLTFLYLYLTRDGEVEHGIESLVFNSPNEAWKFIDQLPEMKAIDFLFMTLGVQPGYF